jgi:iron uptake system component EfeO
MNGTMNKHTPTFALVALLLVLGGCASSNDVTTTIDVISTDDTCEVAPTEAPIGSVEFSVRNDGSDVTEFYLYEDDGTTVVGEVEDIGPGLTRSLVVQPGPGSYVTACKPGMSGDGIRGVFHVTTEG